MPRNEPADALPQVVSWLAALWGIELLDHLLTPILMSGAAIGQDGFLDLVLGLHPWNHSEPLVPQLAWGVVGLFCAPLLHAGWGHLIANSLALTMLGLVCFRYSSRLTYTAIAYAMVTSAVLTWLIAPPQTVHVGVSGVIFGLVGFLIANGILRRGCMSVLIALGVLLLYGGALAGMVPHYAGENVSWQMHLGGFIGGLAASWRVRKQAE